MKNYYNIIENKLEGYHNEEIDYYRLFEEYFNKEIIPSIFTSEYTKINLINYEEYKDLNNIKVSALIDPYSVKSEDSLIDYDFFKSVIINYFKSHNIEVRTSSGISIYTTLNHLKSIYEKYTKNKLETPNLIEYTTYLYDNDYYSKIYNRYFNRLFLDKISHIIEESIREIDYSKYKDFSLDNKISKELCIYRKHDVLFGPLTENDIIFNKEINNDTLYEMLELRRLIENFINDYHLGKVTSLTHFNHHNIRIGNSSSEVISVKLDTTLKELLNAYYMELQRVEYERTNKG